MTFTQTVDRWVGDLREILTEEMMQSAIAARQHCQWRIIPHRPHRFFTLCCHGLENKFHIFHIPASHNLAAAARIFIRLADSTRLCLRQNAVHLLSPANPCPPVLTSGKLIFQLSIFQKLTCCQIHGNHLTWA